MLFVNVNCDRVVIENPTGIMSKIYRPPDQIIQPFQFGHPVEKRTCLWLRGVPRLRSITVVKPAQRLVLRSGKTMDKLTSDAWNLEHRERRKLHARTFKGVAEAMANQWNFK